MDDNRTGYTPTLDPGDGRAMNKRFAFTAEFWGAGAVVCRAVEGCPGPIVDQQFGEFPTWTQASTFAAKLNEGLELDPLDVREIITSSILASACVVHAALASNRSWHDSPVGLATRAAHVRFVLAQLALARTFCRSARILSGEIAERMVRNAQNAAVLARQFMALYAGDYGELQGISTSLTALTAVLPPYGRPREPLVIHPYI